jgi:hypothetical protein
MGTCANLEVGERGGDGAGEVVGAALDGLLNMGAFAEARQEYASCFSWL